MNLSTKLNTVFLLVGPSMCGKSTFATSLKNALIQAGDEHGLMLDVAVLSSDANRYRMLGEHNDSLDKHDPRMMEVSSQAFDILFAELRTFTSYPANKDFIVVDTTGLNEKFRDEVRQTAQAAGYNVELVVFDYKKPELLAGIDEKYHGVMKWHLDRLKKDVLPNLKAKQYAKRIRISERDPNRWQTMTAEIEGLEGFHKSIPYLQKDEGVAIIGDVHEHVEALQAMLAKLDEQDPNLLKAYVGDYLDKGGNTETMVKFMHDRVTNHGDILVAGNHEAYVVRRLRGEIKPNPEIEETYITSLKVLLERPDLQELVFDMWDNYTVPFLRITQQGSRTVFVTHAPCDEIHLGKFSDAAIKAQRNLYRPNRTVERARDDYDFVFKQAAMSKPLHVFGHVAHNSDKLVYKNKVFLDTGAVYGHKLTAFVFKDDRYEFVQVDAKKLTDKELSNELTQPVRVEKAFNIADYDLDPREIRFVNSFEKKGAKFISGTMAPAPSTADKLEGLDAAFEYFRKHGVNEVVLQPKYMGSRCQLYLRKDPEQPSFAVSRNGYIIPEQRHPGLDQVIADWLTRVDGWLDGNWKEIILDGELLPWSTLGKGLIEDHFRSYGHLIGWELGQLNDPEFQALDFNTKPDLTARSEDLVKFFETLSLYDKDVGDGDGQVPMEFKAFSILALDGKPTTDQDQAGMFNTVSNDELMTVSLDNDENVGRAHEFFKRLTVDAGMEGVVVKPRKPAEGVVPYLKVRNEEYLRLVYGYDYPRRYDALCRQKNISGKIRLSLKEWGLGQKMLTAKGDELKELVVKMIGSIKQEANLDPRL